MILRPQLLATIQAVLERSRVVGLFGPRQCGKTTLARQLVPGDSANYFDLDDPVHHQRLSEPMTALGSLHGLAVIDEVQRRPELFPILRVLVDRVPLPAKFLVLGSASPDLRRGSSESLAGRMTRLVMGGLRLAEVGAGELSRHWLRGGLPLSFLAADDEASMAWRRDFVQTVVERDIPQLGVSIAATTLLRFWSMIAHYHGQVWNGAEIARSLGIGEATARRYLDLLTDAYLIRQLAPWHANIKKRQVKSPKVYVRDSGLLHQLVGIDSDTALANHPKCGASWEGYVIEELLASCDHEAAYFWGTHQGAEIDLLLQRRGRLYGFEVKRADAPKLTPSMRTALADLGLERITVIYPGPQTYSIHPRIRVIPLAALPQIKL
jgi:hypothetical protein